MTKQETSSAVVLAFEASVWHCFACACGRNQQLNLPASLEVVKTMRGIWGKDDVRLLKMPWLEIDSFDIEDMKLLFRCLHTITGTSLNEALLREAVQKIKMKAFAYKLREDEE